jgi:hypothetical protein
MARDTRTTTRPGLSRRSFLHGALLLAGGAAAGCTPARAILGLYHHRFDDDEELVDAYLRAFVLTVIPGASSDAPHLTRIFTDPAYPFAEHCGLFTSDLARRSASLHGTDRFDRLDESARMAVVRDALGSDAITAELYRGAILVAQVAFYGSVYDDTAGCAMIDFPGANAGFGDDVMYYPNTRELLGPALTVDGNHP